jgi:CheY-like chemotaxis protein
VSVPIDEAKSILVVLPDHELRVAARKLLEETFGLFLLTVANPIDGLATLQKIKAPSLIFLADDLPLMTPSEFLDLKGRDPKLTKVPVVLMTKTAKTTPLDGVCGIISIPFDLAEIRAVVKQHCGVDLASG